MDLPGVRGRWGGAEEGWSRIRSIGAVGDGAVRSGERDGVLRAREGWRRGKEVVGAV